VTPAKAHASPLILRALGVTSDQVSRLRAALLD
jgi:hypothetical protein